MFNTWARPSNFVSRVSYGLVAEIGTGSYPRIEDGVAKTRRRILEWIGAQTGYTNLAERVGQPFDLPDQPGVKLGLAISADNSMWISKMERPDRDIPQRSWMTEAAVLMEGRKAFLAVRNTCTAPADSMVLPRSVPNLVRTVSRIVGLYDADESLDRNAWYIESADELEDLYALVTSVDRFMPVVLVTEPYAVDIDELAKVMYGVAHVVALPNRLSYDWATAITKPFHAFLGAVRTYNPGLVVDASDPFDHPMALPDRIRSFANNGETGADAFEQLLVERVYASNAARIVTDARGVRYSQVSVTALEARRAAAVATNSVDEIQGIFDAEIAAYQKQVDDSKLMEAAALEDNAALESENQRMRRSVFEMQTEVARMQSVLEAAGKAAVEPVPDNFDDFDDEFPKWVEHNLSGRVVLLPRALRELKQSEYERPSDIYNGLLLLANEFWRMKAGQLDYDAFGQRLAELRMEYGGSIDPRNANDSYYVNYRGKRQFMEMALKMGNSREARYCMRIYTFWDNELRVSVVGSLPRHLDNSMS
jgi:hypothetical protein